MEAMDVCTAWGPQGPDCLALAIELQLDAQGAAAAEAAVGSPEAGALGALGVQSLTSHPGPGSSEAHPAGRMIGIGLRAREP